ncbi:MAG: response regulator [Leptospiraceae bacterium]|nr:response regulator [Leptospiraceae bacterium]MCP5512531.1 response regulator [Leptospiraceae bacterium]
MKNVLKRFIIIFVLIFFNHCDSGEHSSNEKGHFFLNPNTSIQPIKGYWDIYWGKHILPGEIHLYENQKEHIKTGVAWTYNNRFPPVGIATFRMKIHLPGKIQNISLKFNDPLTSARIYANGLEIGRMGSPGKTEENTIEATSPAIFQVKDSEDRELDLIVHVSNFRYYIGGMKNEIYIGNHANLDLQYLRKISYDIFFSGIAFMVGLYHLVIFLFRNKAITLIHFAIFCISISSFNLFTGEREFILLSPFYISWDLMFSVIHIFLSFSTFFFTTFLDKFFRLKLSQKIYSILFFIFLLNVFVNLIPGNLDFLSRVILFYILLIPGITYSFLTVLLALIQKKKHSLPFLIIVLVILLCVILDSFSYTEISVLSFKVLPFGMTFGILLMSYVVVSDSTQSINELDLFSERLEKQVLERTEQIQLLLQEQKRLVSTLRYSKEYICITDSQGQIIFANIEFEKLFHETLKLKNPIYSLPFLYGNEKLKKRIWKNIFKNNFYSEEIEVPNGNHSIPMDILFIRVAGESNETICFSIVGRDISSRKKIEQDLQATNEKLETANRVKDEFLATMSHEMRTPLNAIIGLTELISRSNLNSEQMEFLSTIHNNAKHLNSQISTIFDYGLMQVGKLRARMHRFAFKDLMKVLYTTYLPIAKDKNLELTLVGLEDMPEEVISDESKIYQILGNILSNAVKFTERGQIEIVLRVESYENTFSLNFVGEIRDSGIGMEEDKLKSIYQPFHQLSSKYSRKYEGIGLGLFFSRSLLHLLGGEISIQSEVNKGTKVKIEFPIEIPTGIEDKVKTREVFSKKEGLYDTKDIKIMVVEDNLLNQKLIVKYLQKLGHSPDIANNGQECLNLAYHKNYDIIFMDIQMPIMDGVEATRKLIEYWGDRKYSKIIATTANAMTENSYIELGMDDYIGKPISFEMIRMKIEEMKGRS